MPTLEAIRNTAKETIDINEKQLSKAFSIRYKNRRLFGGAIANFRNPFSGEVAQSDHETELQFPEGAFKLPKNPGVLRKLCHSLGVTPPLSKEDITEFVKNQILGKKDSEGNYHLEIPYSELILRYRNGEQQQQVINAIQAAEAPENPDSCSDITVTINGEKIDIHAHGPYEGNNKTTLVLFALLGHKPSQAFLAKWVEKDFITDGHSKHFTHDYEAHDHFHEEVHHEHTPEKGMRRFIGSSEEIAQQVASVIIERREEENHLPAHEESTEKKEAWDWDKRFAAAAEVIHGAVFVNNEKTKELAETLMKDKFFGEITEEQMIRLSNKAIRETNEKHTKTFKEKLAAVRQEKPVDSQELALTLAKMHDPTIKKISLDEKLPDYTQLTRRDLVKILALHMTLQTDPQEEKQTPQTKRIARYARRINEEKGIYYINLTMNHATALHLIEIRKGVVEACPEHTQQVDKLLQKMQNTIRKQVAQFNQTPIRILLLNRLQPVRGGGVDQSKRSNQKKITSHPSEPTSPNRPNRRSQGRPIIPEKKERPISIRPPTRNETKRPKEKRENNNMKQEAAPKEPAVFLRPASSGIRPQGYRLVKKAEEADWIANVMSYSPVAGTSTDILRSRLNALLHEQGRLIAVAASEKAQAAVHTRESREQRQPSSPVESDAKATSSDAIRLAAVRKAIQRAAQKAIKGNMTTQNTQTFENSVSIASPPTEQKGRAKKGKTPFQMLKKLVAQRAALSVSAQPKVQLIETPTSTVNKPQEGSKNTSASKKPVLRLVKDSNGIASDKTPQDASSSAPEGSPNIAVRPTEEPRPVPTLIKSNTMRDNVLSSTATRATNANEAAATVTVAPKHRRTTVSYKSNTTVETSHPSDNSPKNLNASDAEAAISKAIQKVDGIQTAKQIEEAFKQKSESKIEKEVTSQLEQAASETSPTETATSHETKRTTSETSRNYQQAENGATEKVTKRKVEVAPGIYEERYITEKIERVKTSQTKGKEASEEDQISDKQATQEEITQEQKGTNEAARQATGQQQQSAPLISLSSRRRRQESQITTHSAIAQVAANDGYYLPTDPFGARDAFKQAFAEIAA